MKRSRASLSIIFLIATIWCPISVSGQTGQPPAPSPEMRNANALFNEKKWSEAIPAYETVTKAEPKNGQAWYRLGVSHLSLGHYEQAAEALHQAESIGHNPLVMYNLACAYSRLKKIDQAYEWLNKALTAGFNQFSNFQTDPDLENVRTDARFPELLKAADKAVSPCKYEPKSRQFDFWIGEWEVSSKGQKVATSSIQLILGSCVIFENYTNGGYTGKSFNYFDATTGKWHQTWVDAVGGSIEFTGEFKDGAMVLVGESHQLNSPKTLQRMTFTQIDRDKVRQFGETSSDEGKTWSVSYDLLYERKKS